MGSQLQLPSARLLASGQEDSISTHASRSHSKNSIELFKRIWAIKFSIDASFLRQPYILYFKGHSSIDNSTNVPFLVFRVRWDGKFTLKLEVYSRNLDTNVKCHYSRIFGIHGNCYILKLTIIKLSNIHNETGLNFYMMLAKNIHCEDSTHMTGFFVSDSTITKYTYVLQ